MPTIAPGTRFGVYEILAPLGAGGMGEVYRARDTKLKRDAAVKVLPAELAEDRDRLGRFELEARAASSLNHPNIVTIYEIGDANGVPYIAMELVEGRTLRHLLTPGALAIRRLLEIAAQAAEGLAKAHGAGIVHRDLKPENLMVTADGYVKILDFGLAKLSAHRAGDRVAVTTVLDTQPGAVMGTTYYMSPEQASGHDVDFRSDQFALGSILYEMATGKRAFQASTAAQTMAAIIQEEPEPIAQTNPKVPPPLRWVIERCLAKERERRYASTTDLARDLATLRDRLSEASTTVGIVPLKAPRRRLRMAALVAALIVAAAGAAWTNWKLAARPLPTFTRLTFGRGAVTNARFSPDEKTVAYSAAWGASDDEIFTVREDSPESRPLGIKDAKLLAVSASGEALIWQQGTIAQVPLGGGAPRPRWQGYSYNADWSPDGQKVALLKGWRAIEFPSGKRIYEVTGGRRITYLRVSPDGKRLAFIQTGLDFVGGSVVIVDADGKELTRTRFWPWAFGLAWSARGDEVWVSASEGRGAFDLLKLELSGRLRKVVSFPGSVNLLDIARDGRLLLTRETRSQGFAGLFPGAPGERDLSWLDDSRVKDLSADGRTVLFDEAGEGSGDTSRIYLRSTDGSPAVRLGDGQGATISPDGKWVATLPEGGKLRLLPTGAGEARSLSVASLIVAERPGWHPDGKRVVLSGKEEGKGWRCYAIDIESEAMTAITPEGFASLGVHAEPQISPDGRQLIARERRDAPASLEPGKTGIFGLDSGKFRALEWLTEEQSELYWTSDGRGLLSHRHVGRATEIFRFDLATGASEVLHRIAFSDLAGMAGEPEPEGISPDGKWYVYGYARQLNDLFVVSGVN